LQGCVLDGATDEPVDVPVDEWLLPTSILEFLVLVDNAVPLVETFTALVTDDDKVTVEL